MNLVNEADIEITRTDTTILMIPLKPRTTPHHKVHRTEKIQNPHLSSDGTLRHARYTIFPTKKKGI